MSHDLDGAAAWAPYGEAEVLAPWAEGIDGAERLYRDRWFADALVAGQSLLTRPSTNAREEARIHGLVADCLAALGEPHLAARHAGLAGEGPRGASDGGAGPRSTRGEAGPAY